MMGLDQARYETQLHTAQRALFNAMQLADLMNNEGARIDLFEMREHLAVLLDDSLRNRKRVSREQWATSRQLDLEEEIQAKRATQRLGRPTARSG